MYLLFGRTNNDCITFFFHFTHDNENMPFPIDGNLWYNTKPLVFHLYLFDDSNRTLKRSRLLDSQCHKNLMISQLRNSSILGNSQITKVILIFVY